MEDCIKEKEIDNGGAIAIKGFNYQDAIATLIIITNYTKNDFCIYLECKEDIEVDVDNRKFFIQVKSNELTLSKIIKADKDNNKSILSKNVTKNSSKQTRYKIVTPTFKEASFQENGLIFNTIYKYTDEQKGLILEKLKQQAGVDKSNVEERLNNSYIYVSPFDANLEQACIYLKGLMAENKINVDAGRGDLLLKEILHEIHIKSERKINQESDVEKKKIKFDDLKKLSKVEDCFGYMEEIVNKLEVDQYISFAEKIEINKIIRVVDLKHKSEKKQVDDCIQKINHNRKVTEDIREAYNSLQNEIIISKSILYAVLIDKYVMEAINA